MKVVNLSELEDRLGIYIREVKAGVTVLVTEQGAVVAELRPPHQQVHPHSNLEAVLERWAAEGKVTRGLPNSPDAYRGVSFGAPAGLVERLIGETRGER